MNPLEFSLEYQSFHLHHDLHKQNRIVSDNHLTSLINQCMTMYSMQEYGIHHHMLSLILQYGYVNIQYDMNHGSFHLLIYQMRQDHFLK